MTLTDAAKYMRVSRNTVARLVKEGKLSAVKDEIDLRQTRVQRSEVDALLKRTGRQPAIQP